MRVMVMIKANPQSEAGHMPGERLMAEMVKFNEQLMKAGILKAAGGLQPSATGKRLVLSGGKRSVLDGPFAETKELIAGYWIWEVGSMDEAVQWLGRCPEPDPGTDGVIEIRPMFEEGACGLSRDPEIRAEQERVHADMRRQLSA
jgi:hypothetical protein